MGKGANREVGCSVRRRGADAKFASFQAKFENFICFIQNFHFWTAKNQLKMKKASQESG